MASLSYYSALQLEPNIQELNSEEMPMQLPPELLIDFNYDEQSFYNNPEAYYFDPLFDPNEFILPVETSHNSDPFMSEYSIFESNSKRQKVFQDNCLPNIITSSSHDLFNGVLPNPPTFQDFSSYSYPEIPMHVFSSGCCSNNAEVVVKKGGSNNNEKKMSAQSIAARQRRKKITEKTQELGKLIPGGHRMNTAEMLQATFKYIKFLQAQAGLIELMRSYQKNEKLFLTSDLHKLVGSSLIQEKLYSSEKCLIPKDFLEALENIQELQHSQGFEEVKPFLLDEEMINSADELENLGVVKFNDLLLS